MRAFRPVSSLVFQPSLCLQPAASSDRRPSIELSALSLLLAFTFQASQPSSIFPMCFAYLFAIPNLYSEIRNQIFPHSPFRIPHSLTSTLRPPSSETIPAKASIKLITLHMVASFGSPSRYCKVLKPGQGLVYFCRFVWLKILDKPNVE